MSRASDIAVVGGGVTGCSVALALAERGAQVTLFEPRRGETVDSVCEWIHPRGVEVLRTLGVEVAGTLGDGFVLYGDDRGSPIAMSYQDGRALCVSRAALLAELWRKVESKESIKVVSGRVERVTDAGVFVEGVAGAHHANRVVGADGRRSVVRRAMGLPGAPAELSRIAVLVMHGLKLPFPGMCHLVVGGPGPAMLVGAESEVWAYLDVPAAAARTEAESAVLRRFVPAFPAALRGPLMDALGRGEIKWHSSGFSPRSVFGQDSWYLAGDALGFVHFMAGAGITNGLLDAEALVRWDSVAAYERERRSYVPELLANALYAAFAGQDTEARTVRRGLFHMLRASEAERQRAMRLVAGQEEDGRAFVGAFMSTAIHGAAEAGMEALRGRRSRKDLLRLGMLLRWPAAAVIPRKFAAKLRGRSGPDTPLGIGPVAAGPARAEEARENRSEDWDACRAHLQKVSRSFSQPISLLPRELEVALTVGYLLCRIADTLEDHKSVPAALRDPLFDVFLAVLGDRATVTQFLELFQRGVEVDPEEDAEVALAFAFETVLRVFGSMSTDTRSVVLRWVTEMAFGMRTYAQRLPGEDGLIAMYSLQDLERYCYFVAGTVGHMVTDLFLDHMQGHPAVPADHELRAHAESFGIGLQLVNIVKDVTDDRERSWSFIPRDVCVASGLQVSDLTDPAFRSEAHRALGAVIDRAEGHLSKGLDYVLAIPTSFPQLRLFCLIPLWMAVRTLRVARANDAVLQAGRSVKIARLDVVAIVAECTQFVTDDHSLRQRFGALATARGTA